MFLNIITNSLYTYEHYISVAVDLCGTLKSAYKENICYAYNIYKIIKLKAWSVAFSLLPHITY
jgi:hypothetical protein